MSIATSVLEELLQKIPRLRSQLYFKSSLTALSHAMEDQVLAGLNQPLVIASFQRERFYRQEAHRYLRIAELTPQVYVLAAPETSFVNASEGYETIAFEPDDQLSQEWHLVVIGQQYATCLICRERKVAVIEDSFAEPMPMDQTRRFEGIWTFDRQVSCTAARILLDRILEYRPELATKIQQARQEYLTQETSSGLHGVDPDPFVQRLVTYLQAGQYKLLKAYRSISAQERKERLVNSITAAIRRSLDPEEIFAIAVQELGQAMDVCRCILYRCKPIDASVTVQHEFLASPSLKSLSRQTLSLQDNPLFQVVVQKRESVAITDTWHEENYDLTKLKTWIERWQIRSWVMVPIVYQGRLMGMVELHGCAPEPHPWADDEIAMVEAIALSLESPSSRQNPTPTWKTSTSS